MDEESFQARFVKSFVKKTRGIIWFWMIIRTLWKNEKSIMICFEGTLGWRTVRATIEDSVIVV